MIIEDDIIERINSDFGERAKYATTMLEQAIEQFDYLRTDRVIRCMLYLANGNLTDLSKYIESAISDTRDVMLWAEYEKLSGELNYRRIRNFNQTFEDCTKNVHE